jgi:hypothetical protein
MFRVFSIAVLGISTLHVEACDRKIHEAEIRGAPPP